MEKQFVSAQSLLEDSFELGLQIFESAYRPTFIMGVWRGGAPIGIAVQEILDMLGQPTDHFAIRTSSYGGGTVPSKQVQVIGLEHVVKRIDSDDNLLIIDDVFDTGLSIDAILTELRSLCVNRLPKNIRVAALYYKPKRNKTERTPDFYIHETDSWTVFPHELRGCNRAEILAHKAVPKRFFDVLEREKPTAFRE